MKRIGLFLASGAVAALASWSALGQQGPGPTAPGPFYGYGHMSGWGSHPGMIFAPFLMLLALIGIVTLILWLVRAFSHGGYHHWYGHGACPHCGHGRSRPALDILEERFAKGELGRNEFEEMRKLLGR